MSSLEKLKQEFNIRALLETRPLELIHLKLTKAIALNMDYLKLHEKNPRLKIDGADRMACMDERDVLLDAVRTFEKITGNKVDDPIRDPFIANYAREDKAVEFNMNVGAIWDFAAQAKKAGLREGGRLCKDKANFTTNDQKSIASTARLAHTLDWSLKN